MLNFLYEWFRAFCALSEIHTFTGKLEKGAVLKAICAGFEETTEPGVCLSGGKSLPLSLNSNEDKYLTF